MLSLLISVTTSYLSSRIVLMLYPDRLRSQKVRASGAAPRRAEDVGDVPRWIQLGGHVVANDGGRGTKDAKMAVE
jgi:hypothetical protein